MFVTYPDVVYLSGCCYPQAARQFFVRYPCGVACRSTLSFPNLARNSSLTISGLEITSLQFQRFFGVLKSDRVELRAPFVGKYV